MLTSASLSVGTRSNVALFRVIGERTILFLSVVPLMSKGVEKLAVDMIPADEEGNACWLVRTL